MARFHDHRDEPELVSPFDFPGEDTVGFYDNRGADPAVIVVTTRGLRFPSPSEAAPIDFRDIAHVGVPRDKVNGPFELSITMQSGAIRTLPIAGVYGQFKDVYEFSRFLRGVTADAKEVT
jgi:hypothetical protein